MSVMNRCPSCREPVLEMAAKCRHCGAVLDEKTFFLGEEEVLDEIRLAREQHALKLKRAAVLARITKVSRAMIAVGALVVVLAVAFGHGPSLALGAFLGVLVAMTGGLMPIVARKTTS